MPKKLLLSLVAVVTVTAGVLGLSAFEAHVINVTAHIENALKVDTTPIAFGTVFPQEYLTRPFAVGLSDSFKGADRVNDVRYVIKQKPKPIPGVLGTPIKFETALTAPAASGQPKITVASTTGLAVGDRLAIGYLASDMEAQDILTVDSATGITLTANLANAHASGERVVLVYKDLCRFLSKTSDSNGTVSEPSYFISGNPSTCAAPTTEASGTLDKSKQVTTHNWLVDLKVPPIVGSVGQDWPASCQSYVVPTDGANYGCDLWIEVTGISLPPTTPETGTLTIVKKIVDTVDNDSATDPRDMPANWSMHVKSGSTEVAGSPQDGTPTGTVYTLAPGTYTVSEAVKVPDDHPYVGTFSGACDSTGKVALVAGTNVTCTITNTEQRQ